MSYDPDDEDDFEEIDGDFEDANEDGKGPRYVRIDHLSMDPADLASARIDRLVEIYRDVRDQLATDRKAFKTREASLKEFLARLSMILRDRADSMGVETFQTSFGTAYRNKKEKFPIEDWSQLTEWIDRTKNFQVLQHRVSSVAVREIREEDGQLPPGVGYLAEITFNVRSPTRKSK